MPRAAHRGGGDREPEIGTTGPSSGVIVGDPPGPGGTGALRAVGTRGRGGGRRESGERMAVDLRVCGFARVRRPSIRTRQRSRPHGGGLRGTRELPGREPGRRGTRVLARYPGWPGSWPRTASSSSGRRRGRPSSCSRRRSASDCSSRVHATASVFLSPKTVETHVGSIFGSWDCCQRRRPPASPGGVRTKKVRGDPAARPGAGRQGWTRCRSATWAFSICGQGGRADAAGTFVPGRRRRPPDHPGGRQGHESGSRTPWNWPTGPIDRFGPKTTTSGLGLLAERLPLIWRSEAFLRGSRGSSWPVSGMGKNRLPSALEGSATASGKDGSSPCRPTRRSRGGSPTRTPP